MWEFLWPVFSPTVASMPPELFTLIRSYFLVLISFTLPPCIALFGTRQKHPYSKMPFALSLHFCILALTAASLHFFSFGWEKFVGVQSIAFLLTTLIVWQTFSKLQFRRAQYFSAPVFLGLSGIALLLSADLFFIMARQGWGLSSDLLSSSAYFRPPFNSDAQRTVALIQALIRGNLSPYLPQSNLVYQVFWHHLASHFVWPFSNAFAFAATSGVLLATALLVLITFLWTLALYRPAFLKHWKLGLLFLVIFFTHADLFGFLSSVFGNGKAGIEADWSYSPPFFRYFSLKLLLLTAPQHAAFFLPFLCFQLLRRFSPSSGLLCGFFFIFSVLCSPVLAVFLFGPLLCWKAMNRSLRARELFLISLGILICIPLHSAIFQFPLHTLFLRPGGSDSVLLAPALGWWLSPFWLLACGGGLSILFFVPSVRRRWNQETLGLCFLGGLLFFYLFTGIEIRRHFAMVLGVMLPLGIFRALPSPRRFANNFPYLRVALSIALLLHGYFLYCYLGKPSALDPKIAWQDYFRMNQEIHSHYPDLAVIAATSYELGLVKPILLQTATTFADALSAGVHGDVSSEKKELLAKVEQSGDILPYARALGYRALLWGPVEEKVWGERGRLRFFSKAKQVYRTGSVSLLTLTDLFEKHRTEIPFTFSYYPFVRAQRLREFGWLAEAREAYEEILRKETSAEAHFGLGLIAFQLKLISQAKSEATQAVDLEPESVDYRILLAQIFISESKRDEAQEILREALLLKPNEPRALKMLSSFSEF